MSSGLVTAANLGADFDLGTQVTNKLNVVPASTTAAGKMRFATAAEAKNGTAGSVMDASQVVRSIAGATGITRATIAAATFPAAQIRFKTYDDAPWIRGTSSGPMAIADGSGQFWQIDVSGCDLNVVWFGADPSGTVECSAAFNGAIAALPTNGGTIHVPSGTYALAHAITWSNKNVAIVGSRTGHPASTVLTFSSATDAGISVSQNGLYGVCIRDLSLVAGVNTTAAAISINFPNKSGPVVTPVYVSDVMIYGVGFAVSFANGILFTNVFGGKIQGVNVTGATSASGTTGVGASNMLAGISLNGNSAAVVIDKYLGNYCQNGIYLADDSEGAKISNSEMVAVNYGIFVQPNASPGAPGLFVVNSHANAFLGGFYIQGWSQATISNCLIYRLGTSTTDWFGISLADYINNGTTTPTTLANVSSCTVYGYAAGAAAGTGRSIAFFFGASATNNKVTCNIAENCHYFADMANGAGPNYLTTNTTCDLQNIWYRNPNPVTTCSGNAPLNAGADPGFGTFAAGATSPSVGGQNYDLWATQNTAATTITNLLNAPYGKRLSVLANDAMTTMANNANIALKGGSNAVMPNGGVLTLVKDTSVWREVARNF